MRLWQKQEADRGLERVMSKRGHTIEKIGAVMGVFAES
jgi:hypothetical protein